MIRTGYNAGMRWLGIMLLVLLTSCGWLGQGIAERAADYYNYMAGQSPRTAYSSYLSPAYRGQMTAEAIEEYDKFKSANTEPNTRYPKATTYDVRVAEADGFAITVVNSELGPLFAAQRPLYWVKAGRQWYLYLGADVEIVTYGQFPAELTVPVWAPEEPEPESDGAEEQ